MTYQSFVRAAGEPPAPLNQTYSKLPPTGDLGDYELLNVPTIQELGYINVEVRTSNPRNAE